MAEQQQHVVRAYLWWGAAGSAVMRGFGLIALLYWVVDAELDPLPLVLLGTAMEVSVFVAEIPTGVVADTLSRKWSLVISHVVMGAGMVATGLTTSLGPLVVAQMVWGVGWTFQSGADVAWVTDELDDADRVDAVLAARARWDLWGGIVGALGFGLLAWQTSRATAIVATGLLSMLLAVAVAWTFTERNFKRAESDHWAESRRIFKAGVAVARQDRQILLVLVATVLFNSGAEAVDRLFTDRLVELGLPQDPDPVVWFTGLSVFGALAGIVALRGVETRLGQSGEARDRQAGPLYAGAAFLSAFGVVVFAVAPNITIALGSIMLARGVGMRVLPVVASVWVNQRSSSQVRATVQSFLGQAESVGEVFGGIALGLLAQQAGVPPALLFSAALFTATGLLVHSRH